MVNGQVNGKPYLENDVFGLMWGSVVGDGHFLTTGTKGNFAFLGIQHMTAASGYNIQLVTSSLGLIFPNSRRMRSLLPLMAIVFFYTGLCNFQPSIMRAAVQWSISSWLNYFQRPISGSWCLSLSVLLLCFLKPEFLTLIGFQLSVAATAGILLFAKNPFARKQTLSIKLIEQRGYVSANKITSQLRLDQRAITRCFRYAHETSRLSLAASIFTIPIIYYHFQKVSVWFILGNLAVQWLMPSITLSSILFFGISLISLSAGFYLKPYLSLPSLIALTLIAWSAWIGREVERHLSFFK